MPGGDLDVLPGEPGPPLHAEAALQGGRLGGREDLQQLPEELDVEVAPRVADREIVELLGGEAVERIVLDRHGAEPIGGDT